MKTWNSYFYNMNLLDTKKKEFRSQLPNKGIMQTIDSLKNFILEESKKINILILLESYFKGIRSRQQQGIISWDAFNLEENGTRKKLLDFIDDLEWEDTKLSIFTDPRDGQTYRTVEMLGKMWMAENLNYDVGEGCWFYDNDPFFGKKYGRLYTWETTRKACPQGWRLPTDEEWKALVSYYGGYYDHPVGNVVIGNPIDSCKALMKGGSSGFNVLCGGYRDPSGSFLIVGAFGHYWSATEHGEDNAYSYYVFSVGQRLGRVIINKGYGRSVRCLRD